MQKEDGEPQLSKAGDMSISKALSLSIKHGGSFSGLLSFPLLHHPGLGPYFLCPGGCLAPGLLSSCPFRTTLSSTFRPTFAGCSFPSPKGLSYRTSHDSLFCTELSLFPRH